MHKNNVIKNVYPNNDSRRFKIFYDRKPTTSSERDKRICLVLKSSGQVLRFDEGETLDLIMDLSKALKWKQRRGYRY
jgi:hypothetical protein